MRYFSMFTGIGGFELGIQRALSGHPRDEEETERQGLQGGHQLVHSGHPSNARCVGYSEIDKHAIQTFETNFGKEIKNYGDATKINTADLPDFDLLVGGFPCQAFSIAGKRAGFEDTRGTLIFDVVRILRDKRPRYFILENVKGLLSHEGGKTFSHILEILTDTGYDVSWSIHNSKNYGVPQNRERIYLIGNLRGEPRPQVFPNEAYPRQDIIYDVSGSQRDRVYNEDGLAPTIPTMQGGNTHPKVFSFNRKTGIGQELENAHTLSASDYRGLNRNQDQNAVIKVVSATKTGYEEATVGDGINIGAAGSTTRRGRVQKNASQTLNTSGDVGTYDGLRIRRLTPTECERLQGFPDGWTVGSDTQRYKQCGNAITVNVVEHVAKEILKCQN